MFKTIEQLEAREEIQGYYLVKMAQIKTTAAGKKYLDATLIDATGSINAKVWDGDEVLLSIFKEGEIVKVSAQVKLWQNNKQLSINKYRPINANDEVDIENFVPSAPIKANILYDAILEHIDGMTNEAIKELCKGIILEKKDAFLIYPAAKSNHHAIRSGLMYHIYRMLELAQSIHKVYNNFNIDLLKAGVVLHDICKIDEMEISTMGLVSEYSKKGNLLGHITMGVELVAEKGRQLHIDEEIILMIQHMLLSHHDKAEYGSPKPPMFIEAELLHHIDMIDARVYDFENITRQINVGEFSEQIWSLDRRRVYKHGIE